MRAPISKLYLLVRHAKAMDRRDYGRIYSRTDYHRPLTPKGIREFQRILRRLEAKPFALRKIYSSPFTRCRQTAKLLSSATGIPFQTRTVLGHGASVEAAFKWMQKSPSGSAFVGHEPELTMLLELMVVRVRSFRKGEIRCYEMQRNGKSSATFKLRWSLK